MVDAAGAAALHPIAESGHPASGDALCWDRRRCDGGHVLVIGIGNPLRSDDGVGWWLVRRAERWLPATQLRTVQQLTPELAADLAAATRVLFIDAWCVAAGELAAAPGPQLRCLEPTGPVRDGSAEPAGAFSHQLAPGQLLGISELLLGRRPKAWQLLVPAFTLAHGEGFSQQLNRQLPGAEHLLRLWIQAGPATAVPDHA